ncbi:glutamate--tRNA ligase [Tepidimonas taiwanensis]|uniref:Glutamate--tRNA ligase n=1 Tax=Tepidimonas taiwanensis TaxID=307486 RepID=A0A554XD67_9BURK|nr:glutamate--tRNA ligase [Tepidimonas taiwanensis]MCX7693522.1 glutamate--tRNA ligase [Tepidimonas taiwanensis]MDM7464313.1 glutamate--tRNA ligase [Tepidimonas taiwanensis]TSE33729.1 Glutamate--tRNA ligase [Tepidimonas taiwanensis]UBQ06722.1 glutamate--tRNA ligase [Tepidimonas taiwanensis]
MTARIRTRFAPSPTGFIHLGNIRSALYPWAFARANGGDFILRIEDTDQERSTQEAVDVILEAMDWLGLTPDEGPYYQMQRMDRYRQVIAEMLAAGLAYHCYMTPAELDALRERQMAAKLKPRYDGTWRPEPGKTLPPVPDGVLPVIRFKNPTSGSVVWDDKVKGRVEIRNDELDDLVIARQAPVGEIGTPTYNFCVVVDDIDMRITHVIRGDDHVNNTPRQINIFRALGHEPPVYAHLPTVLNEQGEKMSKRHGAKPVTWYRDAGFLPEAMINYLARLGWSHGDDEIFTREQFLQWFDLEHLGRSAAQFDEAKLRWVNAQHIKMTPDERLAPLVAQQLARRGLTADERLPALCALFKDRCDTTVALADWAQPYYATPTPRPEDLAQHVTDAVRPALRALAARLADTEWTPAAIGAAIKATLAEHGLKMPQLAMPVRVLVMGTPQTPSVDAVLALHRREDVLARLAAA